MAITNVLNLLIRELKTKNAKGVIFIWVGTAVSAVFAFLTQVFLARGLGAEDYGVLSASLGFTVLLTPIAGFGVTGMWLKCFGSEGWKAKRWIKPSFNFVLVTAGMMLVCTLVWAWAGPNDSKTSLVLSLLAFTVLGSVVVEIVSAKYQLEEKFLALSFARLMPILLRFSVVFFVFYFYRAGLSSIFISVAYALIALIIVMFYFIAVTDFRNCKIDLQGHEKLDGGEQYSDVTQSAVAKNTWCFGVVGVLYLAWGQGHVVFAQHFLGDVEAGLYNSALVLLNAVCLLPSVFYSRFMLPKLHRWAHHDLSKLKRAFELGNIYMISSGFIALIFSLLIAMFFVEKLFGEEFGRAVGVLIILSLTLPVRFFGYCSGSLLVTKNFMSLKLKVMSMAVVVNLALALVLTPVFGLEGLAATVVVTELLLVWVYFILAKKMFDL